MKKVFLLAFIAFGLTSCSPSEEEKAKGKARANAIASLEPGMTIADTKGKLGEPDRIQTVIDNGVREQQMFWNVGCRCNGKNIEIHFVNDSLSFLKTPGE